MAETITHDHHGSDRLHTHTGWADHEGGPHAQPSPRTVYVGYCPRCGAVSHHPDDMRTGYCNRCQWWTYDPTGTLNQPWVLEMAEAQGVIPPAPASPDTLRTAARRLVAAANAVLGVAKPSGPRGPMVHLPQEQLAELDAAADALGAMLDQ